MSLFVKKLVEKASLKKVNSNPSLFLTAHFSFSCVSLRAYVSCNLECVIVTYKFVVVEKLVAEWFCGCLWLISSVN